MGFNSAFKELTVREEDTFPQSVHISGSRLRKLTSRSWFCARTYVKPLYNVELSDAEYSLSITCQEHLLQREKGKRRTAHRRNAILLLFRITKYISSVRTHNFSTYPKNVHTFIVGISKYAFIVDISKLVKEDFYLWDQQSVGWSR
jgi:hypothetical protein